MRQSPTYKKKIPTTQDDFLKSIEYYESHHNGRSIMNSFNKNVVRKHVVCHMRRILPAHLSRNKLVWRFPEFL